MLQITSTLTIRELTKKEQKIIARNQPQHVRYLGVFRDRALLAHVGLLDEPGRALITDMYGIDAKAWLALMDYLTAWADLDTIELSGWVSNENLVRRRFTAERYGFNSVAQLVRRFPCSNKST